MLQVRTKPTWVSRLRPPHPRGRVGEAEVSTLRRGTRRVTSQSKHVQHGGVTLLVEFRRIGAAALSARSISTCARALRCPEGGGDARVPERPDGRARDANSVALRYPLAAPGNSGRKPQTRLRARKDSRTAAAVRVNMQPPARSARTGRVRARVHAQQGPAARSRPWRATSHRPGARSSGCAHGRTSDRAPYCLRALTCDPSRRHNP